MNWNCGIEKRIGHYFRSLKPATIVIGKLSSTDGIYGHRVECVCLEWPWRCILTPGTYTLELCSQISVERMNSVQGDNLQMTFEHTWIRSLQDKGVICKVNPWRLDIYYNADQANIYYVIRLNSFYPAINSYIDYYTTNFYYSWYT